MDASSNQSGGDDGKETGSSITKKAIGDTLQEYETQYFGFTPKSFIDGVYNALADYLYDSVDASDKYITSEAQQGRHPVCAEAVRQSSDRLLAHLQLAFDKAFDRLETYLMKNIFPIPAHVILPEDKIHGEMTLKDSSDEARLDAELEELRHRIHNAHYMNARLAQWSSDVKQIQILLDKLYTQLEDYQKVCIHANVVDLKESIVFMATRAEKLLDLSKTLQHTRTRKRAMEDDDGEGIPVKMTLRSGSS